MMHVHEVKLPAQLSPKEFIGCVVVGFSLFFVAVNLPEDSGNWFVIAMRYVGAASGIMSILVVMNVVFGKIKIVRKSQDKK